MTMPEGEHRDALREAIGLEAEAHRALLDGDAATAAGRLRAAAAAYRRSWELAPPRSFGRLIGMLKALVIAGDDAGAAAAYVREQVAEDDASPPAWYALAIAALADGDDAVARRAADGMRSAGVEPFLRTADAIDALARGDRDAYAAAEAAIVADFEARSEHLTGVPIADTALMLERFAERRGLAARPSSALLPAG
jgi:predicted Zn-dependent protease